MLEPVLINANETAKFLGISRSFLYEQVACSRIPRPLKLGKKSLWIVRELVEWVDSESAKNKG